MQLTKKKKNSYIRLSHHVPNNNRHMYMLFHLITFLGSVIASRPASAVVWWTKRGRVTEKHSSHSRSCHQVVVLAFLCIHRSHQPHVFKFPHPHHLFSNHYSSFLLSLSKSQIQNRESHVFVDLPKSNSFAVLFFFN